MLLISTHPYNTKPWKEQRSVHLKPCCEWCGSTESLCIHHLGHGRKDWKALRHKVATALFLASLPENHDATEPDATMTAFKAWKQRHGADIEKAFQDAKEQRLKHYVSMKDSVTICQRCHGNIHKGRVLCSFCGERYHGRKYDCCYTCLEHVHPELWERIEKKRKREHDTL